MKKILIVFTFLLVVGCTPINSMDEMDIIEKNISTVVYNANEFRTGYKYYLPRGLKILNNRDFNEKARGGIYNYYIYIDIVSYYNDIKEPYKIDEKAYLSVPINYNEKYGYLEINEVNGKYLIEIMYNYAKIEVMVKRDDINLAISNSITILSTVKYNDKILANIMDEGTLKLNKIDFNIFETKKDSESSYLTAIDSQGEYEEVLPDPDLIK